MAASVALSMGIVGWAALNIALGWVGFAAIVPVGFRGGMEAAISLARIFAAMVLILIIADGVGPRLRWVASGFVVLGLGQLVFGYIEPIVVSNTNVNQFLYEMTLVRGLAAGLFIIGLVPREPPRFTVRSALGIFLFSVACVSGYWILSQLSLMPQLVLIGDLELAARQGIAPMSWMTGWHWAFAALPLGLSGVAAGAALKSSVRGEIGAWLPLALIVQAGSELHDSLWPSAYGNSVLMNSADILRLGMAAIVVVGGTLELRRIASERTALLAEERERARRLEDLTTLRADFTAMVAHELGYPLSAIRRQAELLSRDGIDRGLRREALSTILRETDALDMLVADVQTSAAVERDEFRAIIRPVQLGALIEDAVAAAEAHSANPPLETCLSGVEAGDQVLADPERVGQVLRNLLCNAAKYSREGTRISLSALAATDGHIRIEVADNGRGIHPDDVPGIFEKFGRGRAVRGTQVSGNGLGLYLSRGILRAHGSDLIVRSSPGAGAVFAFELERASAT